MSDFPALTTAERAVLDALRLDGCSVEPLRQLNPAMPQIIASYNGRVELIRVPIQDDGETKGLEQSKAEQDWDGGWKGSVLVSADIQTILTSILATPKPPTPDSGPTTAPSGMFAVPSLTADTGVSVQAVPGGYTVDEDVFRATYSSTSFSSVELWFRWDGDATTPSGTTRQVGVVVHQADANNALEVNWQWAPSNTGVYVQRKVSGSYTTETATSSTVPASPADGKWHRLRVDVIGTTLTARADGVIVWQGTLSGAAQAISGKPGLRVDNGKVAFVLWTPPVPSTATVIQYDVTPQANRPQQGINTVSGTANVAENVTYESIVASGKTDRVRLVAAGSGFTNLRMRFKPEPGDIAYGSNGNRASLKATGTITASWNRKCFLAYPGDRTRDTFKFRFPAAGLTDETNRWGVFWQRHQEGTVGSSPPLALNYRQHKFSDVYWLWFGINADYWNSIGQGYETFQQSNGTWPLGGEVRWNALLQADHTYSFVVDTYHSTIDAGGTPVNGIGPGWVSLWVDGVQMLNQYAAKTMFDAFNFPDITIYQHPSVATTRYGDGGDYLHELIPGPNNPLFPFYTPP